MMRKKGGALRHLEGWEVGIVAVAIALVGTLLAVPLPVLPRDVPVPLVDGKALSTTWPVPSKTSAPTRRERAISTIFALSGRNSGSMAPRRRQATRMPLYVRARN